jgi:peptidoglycan-associated lipoprotein
MDPFNPQSPLAQQRSVYFEFDSYTVPEQYRSLVEMHASYLSGHTQQKIRIEGNADARGGAEYNLALGQRRSDAVARMMNLLGVNSNQIEAISFGKERPRATGNTEADYAENRRADIVYQR